MPKKEIKKLVLFDAYAILYRAYHALPDFSSSKGQPTGALYGLAAMLMRIIADQKPDYMAACYDLAEATFRKQAYDAYKATRKKTDDELIAQIEKSKELFEAFGIPIYSASGFEADDVIATVVEQTKKEKDLQVVIASGDMDTLQLVDGKRVVVYTLKKGINDTVVYDEDGAREKFGFDPIYLPDYKGLRGDPSDNIIGITGIGEKTATILIQHFGTIEKMYQALKKDESNITKLGLTPRIVNLLKEGEEEALFSKVLATVRRDAPITFKLPEVSWRDALAAGGVESLFAELDFRSLLSRFRTMKQNVSRLPVENKGEKEVGVERPAVEVDPQELRETAVAMWLLNSDITDPDLEDVLTYAKTTDFAEAKKIIFDRLEKEGLEQVYREIEQPLMPIIDHARDRGILVDREYLTKLSLDYHKELTHYEQQIYKLAGKEFNINSPKQLGAVLFDDLELTAKGLRKTAGGERSTRESELEKLRDKHPIIEVILKYREVQKLLSTYIDNIPTLIGEDGRLHSSLHQAGASTGRMSSSNPNMQNIPASEVRGAAIRNAFIATPGYKIVAFDYSQIEMRVLAALSGDEALIDIFKTGKDVHTSVASRVFNVPEDQVTKDMRRQAKVINFGIIYGMGVTALRQNLGSTREEAQAFYDNYFTTFPSIKNYFENVKGEATARGYTETFFGRRRYFPGLKSKLPYLRAMAERMAMNAPLQGTAADLIKIAMRKADEAIKPYKKDAYLLLQIHDELVYEIAESKLEEVMPLIKEAMESAWGEEVRLVVNGAVGERWGEMAKIL